MLSFLSPIHEINFFWHELHIQLLSTCRVWYIRRCQTRPDMANSYIYRLSRQLQTVFTVTDCKDSGMLSGQFQTVKTVAVPIEGHIFTTYFAKIWPNRVSIEEFPPYWKSYLAARTAGCCIASKCSQRLQRAAKSSIFSLFPRWETNLRWGAGRASGPCGHYGHVRQT